MQNSSGSSTITASVPPEIIKESRIQPLWHVIVLNLLTVGFYAPVWFYKNAKDLSNRLKYSSDIATEEVCASAVKTPKKERKPFKKGSAQATSDETETELPSPSTTPEGPRPARISMRDSSDDKLAPISYREKNALDLVKRIPPLFLILGMALPLINLFLGMYFFKMLTELNPDAQSSCRKHPFIVGTVMALTLIGSLCLFKLPGVWFLLYCPAMCIPLCFSQHWLNKYWETVELDGDLMVRHSFSTSELVMLILGILLLGLIIAGFYVVPFDTVR